MRGHTPHHLDVAIGQRIRERRRALRLTQQTLAEKLGLSFQQVQKYEQGANRVSFSRLMAIAEALRCSLEDLADGLDLQNGAELARITGLMATDGALAMLEAYAALPNDELRRELLRHARAVRSALAELQPAEQAR